MFEVKLYFIGTFLLKLIASRGNYGGWKATCIGNNSSSAVSLLKQEYGDGNVNIVKALDIGVKVLSKSLDMTKLTPDKIEIATLQRINGKTVIRLMSPHEIEKLIKKFEINEKNSDEESNKDK